jgi:hypothetical protein
MCSSPLHLGRYNWSESSAALASGKPSESIADLSPLDATYAEDRFHVRTGNGPCVMASLRDPAITILRLTGKPVSPLPALQRLPGQPIATTIMNC